MYTANDIARMLKAAEEFDNMITPSSKQVYDKVKPILDLIASFVPETKYVDNKYLEIPETNLRIKTYCAYSEIDEKLFRDLTFCSAPYTSPAMHIDCYNYHNPEKAEERIVKAWYAVIKNKDNLIEQVVSMRQRANKVKADRINLL